MNLITQNGIFVNKNNSKNCYTINQNIGTSANEKKIGNYHKIFGILNYGYKQNSYRIEDEKNSLSIVSEKNYLEAFDIYCKIREHITLLSCHSEPIYSNNIVNIEIDDPLTDLDLTAFEKHLNPVKLNKDEHFDETIDILSKLVNRLNIFLETTKNIHELEEFFLILKKELLEAVDDEKERKLKQFFHGMCNNSKIKHFKNAFQRKNCIENFYETINESHHSCYDNYSDSFKSTNLNKHEDFSVDESIHYEYCIGTENENTGYLQCIQSYRSKINNDVSVQSIEGNDYDFIPNIMKDKLKLYKKNSLYRWNKKGLNTLELFYHSYKNKIQQQKRIDSKYKMNKISYKNVRPEQHFTLDSCMKKEIQYRLYKEKRIRFYCRLFFYFMSLLIFILSVTIVNKWIRRSKPM